MELNMERINQVKENLKVSEMDMQRFSAIDGEIGALLKHSDFRVSIIKEDFEHYLDTLIKVKQSEAINFCIDTAIVKPEDVKEV